MQSLAIQPRRPLASRTDLPSPGRGMRSLLGAEGPSTQRRDPLPRLAAEDLRRKMPIHGVRGPIAQSLCVRPLDLVIETCSVPEARRKPWASLGVEAGLHCSDGLRGRFEGPPSYALCC